MTGPALHALAMGVLLGVTVAACVWRGKPEKGPRILAGVLLPLLMIPAYLVFGVHKCDSGDPVAQALLGGGCAIALAVWVRGLVPAHLLTLAALAAAVGLVEHYNGLVHTANVTGNPSYSREYIELEMQSRATDALRELAKSDAAIYPAGWLKEGAFVAKSPARSDLTVVLPRYRTESWWHSWFSGLYGKRAYDFALWFPGGTLTGGATGLEWRALNPAN